MGLLPELVAKGHRTLIFSQSRVMLDILQGAISQKGYTFCRIDGSVASATDRQVNHCLQVMFAKCVHTQAQQCSRMLRQLSQLPCMYLWEQ